MHSPPPNSAPDPGPSRSRRLRRRAGLAAALAAPLLAAPLLSAPPAMARPAFAGTPALALPGGQLVLSGVRGVRGRAETITLRNKGTAPLTVTRLAFVGPSAAGFAIAAAPKLPFVLPAGGTAGVAVAVQSAATGVLAAALAVASNDPAAPNQGLALRGLVLGDAGAEPSLQQILDTWRIPLATGDPNKADIFLPTTAPLGDEVIAPMFVKAGAGPVTVSPLAAYSGYPVEPTARLAWSPAGMRGFDFDVLGVPAGQARTLQLHPTGTPSFEPGAGPFSIAAAFPGSARTVAQDDPLNAGNGGLGHAVRVYPFRAPDGKVDPNAFVLAAEDSAKSTAANCCEWNDLVVVVRNVRRLELVGRNTEGVPFRDRLAVQAVAGAPNPAYTVRATAAYRLTNVGATPRTVLSATVAGPFQLSKLVFPVTVPPGGKLDLAVKLVATSAPKGRAGTLTITTNDPLRPVRTVGLGGTWQPAARGDNEPTLTDIVNGALGFGTAILKPGQWPNTKGARVPIGEEVLTTGFRQADPARRVLLQQLAGFSDTEETIERYPLSAHSCKAAAERCKTLLQQVAADSQTLMPRKSSAGKLVAAETTFTSTAPFALRVGGEDQNDKVNSGYYDLKFGCKKGCGHHVRVWPARDAGGHLIPDSYLVATDVLGINMDFQDAVYLISNVRPV